MCSYQQLWSLSGLFVVVVVVVAIFDSKCMSRPRARYHLLDEQHSDAIRVQNQLAFMAEASKLLAHRDKLRVQHSAEADVDKLRTRQVGWQCQNASYCFSIY